jgi:hypothetical protein
MTWPADTDLDLNNFYGKHQLGPDGTPSASWERAQLTRIALPYTMVLSWDFSVTIRKLTCHKLVADSLTRIFNAILRHYGTEAAVKTARMHLYGGCYNYRRVSGSARLSTHAWGAGIDLDPDRNPLGTSYNESAGMMPQAVVHIFEAEGWRWGGKFQSRPDCMHFQATA